MELAMLEEESISDGEFEKELLRKAFRECGGVCGREEMVRCCWMSFTGLNCVCPVGVRSHGMKFRSSFNNGLLNRWRLRPSTTKPMLQVVRLA